jgi:hypothetical protein
MGIAIPSVIIYFNINAILFNLFLCLIKAIYFKCNGGCDSSRGTGREIMIGFRGVGVGVGRIFCTSL